MGLYDSYSLLMDGKLGRVPLLLRGRTLSGFEIGVDAKTAGVNISLASSIQPTGEYSKPRESCYGNAS